MPWLMIYGSVAVVVLAALTLRFARPLRPDVPRLAAIAAAASLWPLMAIGLAQWGAVLVIGSFLRRHSPATAAPVAAEADTATTPIDLTGSLARLAQQISPVRPA